MIRFSYDLISVRLDSWALNSSRKLNKLDFDTCWIPQARLSAPFFTHWTRRWDAGFASLPHQPWGDQLTRARSQDSRQRCGFTPSTSDSIEPKARSSTSWVTFIPLPLVTGWSTWSSDVQGGPGSLETTKGNDVQVFVFIHVTLFKGHLVPNAKCPWGKSKAILEEAEVESHGFSLSPDPEIHVRNSRALQIPA